MAQPAHTELLHRKHPGLADAATLAMVGSLDETPPSHKAFNPTTKKVPCPQHEDVIIARHKLRTGVTTVPCWRCVGEAALRSEEGETTAEARVHYLHGALQSEKERAVVLERRAATLEEEQEGLRNQIARLVEQVAGLSEELSHVMDVNIRLEMHQAYNRPASSFTPISPPPSLPSSSATMAVPVPMAEFPPAAAAAAAAAAHLRPRPPTPTPAAAAAFPSPAGAVGNGSRNNTLSSSSSSSSSSSPYSSPYVSTSDVTLKAQGGEAGLPPSSGSKTPTTTTRSSSPATAAVPAATASGLPSRVLSSPAAAAAAAAVSSPRPPSVDTEKEGEEGREGGRVRPESPSAQALGAGGSGRLELRHRTSSYLSGGREGGREDEVKDKKEDRQQQEQQQEQQQKKKRRKVWSLFSRKSSSKRVITILHPSLPPSPSAAASDLDNELNEYLSVDLLAKRLLRLLETRPEALLRIYKKSEMLEEWRMEVQLDLGVDAWSQQQGKEGGKEGGRVVDPSSFQGGREGGRVVGPTSYHLEHSASTIFADQMELVGALTDRFKQTVMRYVADSFHLSLAFPLLLEQAIEVVKLHGDFNKKKLAMAQRKMERTGSKDLDRILRLCGIEDWDSEVRLALKEASALRALEVFTIAHLEAAAAMDEGGREGGQGLSREGAMIGAAESLLVDLKEVLGRVPSFFGEEHRAGEVIRGQYDAHLMRQVAVLHGHGMSDMEIGDLFEMNRFLLKYQMEIVLLGAEAPRAELKVAAQACLQECLVRTRQQMGDWYTAILGRKSEVLFDADGRPFTANPEDLFQIVHTQVRRREGGREGGREGSHHFLSACRAHP